MTLRQDNQICKKRERILPHRGLRQIHCFKDETHLIGHLDDFTAHQAQLWKDYKEAESLKLSFRNAVISLGGNILFSQTPLSIKICKKKNVWLSFDILLTFLLSSNTVFMLSIHNVSIGPSNTTHFRSGVSADANSRNVFATMPSVH